MEDLTQKQRGELADWVSAGFTLYAEPWLDELTRRDFNEAERVRIRKRRYSEVFSRICIAAVGTNYFPDLQSDLYGLMFGGCRAVDIVDLMVLCTSESLIFPDCLPLYDITDRIRLVAWMKMKRMGETTQADRREEFFQLLFVLLEANRQMARKLDESPNASLSRIVAIQRPYALASFYLFLEHFGYGVDTLSRLLNTMRLVRNALDPYSKGRRRVHSTAAGALRAKAPRDRFSAGALQRSLHRLFQQNEAWADTKRLLQQLEMTVAPRAATKKSR